MENKTRIGYYCNACGTMLLECEEYKDVCYGEKPEKCNVCGSEDIELDIITKGEN